MNRWEFNLLDPTKSRGSLNTHNRSRFRLSGERSLLLLQNQRNLMLFKTSARVMYWGGGWEPGGGHCIPHCAHLRPPGMGWLITELQREHILDSGTFAACWVALILSFSCFHSSSTPYTPPEEFLNQSSAWEVESA